jgi:glycosyltransferase 2 family protein
MDLNKKEIFKTLNPNKVWIPMAISLGIVFYIFFSDPNISTASLKRIFEATWLPIFITFLFILIRGAGYVYRIRTLSINELTWTDSIYVIILWEFASAVTPSVVGGTAVAVYILLKQGLPFGKALAFVMLTAILDNVFFLVSAPLAIFFTDGQAFPEITTGQSNLKNSLPYFFYLSYGLIALYTCIMGYALLIRPRAAKWVLIKLTGLRILKKWRNDAIVQGDELILASRQLKDKASSYWYKIVGATIFVWLARYLMLNTLITAYTDLSFADHMLLFARSIIMWIVMLVSPTPGSSGTAEYFFQEFYQPFLGEYTFGVSIFWRLLAYYPYLLLGAIVLPRWIRRTFFKKDKK